MASNYTNFCCVYGCRNKQTDDKLTFFPLRKDAERRAEWLKAIGRNDLLSIPETKDRVCSVHFLKTAIKVMYLEILNQNAMPTQFLPSRRLSPEHEHERVSDVATQTDITHEHDKA